MQVERLLRRLRRTALTHRVWLPVGLAGALALVNIEHAEAAQVTTIAQLERPSPVTAWEDTVIWSAYDPEVEAYRLTALHDGEVRTLPVDPLPIEFDADLGPDSSGNAAVVYSRCEDPGERERQLADCDLFIYSLRSGQERPIRNANSDASEFEPTLWRGEVAWARTYEGDSTRPFVYRRPLVAPRDRRSERLPGVPTRNCDAALSDDNCVTFDRKVQDLDLYGRWLALTAEYQLEEGVYEGPVSQLRLSDLRRGETEVVTAGGIIGYDSGSFTAAGLGGGHVVWHSSGASDGRYAPPSRIYSRFERLRLATGRVERLRLDETGQPYVAGVAATPSSIYRVRYDVEDGSRVDNVAVERLDGLRWARP